jgi:hypothetical protein
MPLLRRGSGIEKPSTSVFTPINVIEPRGIGISPQRHHHQAQRGIAIEPRGITIKPTEASPSSPQRHHHRAHRGITIKPREASPLSLQRRQHHRAHSGINDIKPRGISISPEALASAQWHRHRAHSGVNTSSATGSNHAPQHQRVVFRTSFIGGAIAPSSLHDIH